VRNLEEEVYSYTFFFSFSLSLSFSFSFLFSFSVLAFGFFSFGCLFAMAVSNSHKSFNIEMYCVGVKTFLASASMHNLIRFAHFCYVKLWNGRVLDASLKQSLHSVLIPSTAMLYMDPPHVDLRIG